MAPSNNALTTTEDDLPGPKPLQASSYIPPGIPKKVSHETAKTSGCPSVYPGKLIGSCQKNYLISSDPIYMICCH